MSKFVTFRQADSRWGSLPYSRAPYYMSGTGCGPTACASIIYNIKRDITPITTRAYMINNGYCITGNGTAAAGITNCLKHYGYNFGRLAMLEMLLVLFGSEKEPEVVLHGQQVVIMLLFQDITRKTDTTICIPVTLVEGITMDGTAMKHKCMD